MLKSRIFASKNNYVFPIAVLLAVVIYLMCGFRMRFQVALNDFWGVLYYAKHLSIAEPASLYNGFFPIGYPVLLHFIPYSYVTYFAFAMNIAFAGLFVGWISSLLFMIRGSGWGVGLVFLATMAYPLFFRYANTVGPYVGAAAFSMGGVYFLWREELQESHVAQHAGADILTGLLLGLSALFRSDAIILGAAVLLAYAGIVGVGRLWQRKAVPITLALVYLIQVAANLISGHGALETGQSFTAYIAFYGMNWWHIPAEAYSFSVVSQLFKDPIGFATVYVPLFLLLITYGIPSFLCLGLLRKPVERKFAWFVVLAEVMYAIPVAIGTSATDRGRFAILGLAIICSGLLGMELWSRGRTIVGSSRIVRGLAFVFLASAALWTASGWFSANWHFLSRFRNQAASFRRIEAKLVANGMERPAEAFTNKSVLYFPDMPPFRPYSNGGWEDYSLWGYRQEFAEIPTDSVESFIRSCSANKIRFLVLTPGAVQVAGFLDALYQGQLWPDGVSLLARVGDTKIFKIEN